MEKKEWNPELYNKKHSFVYQYGANLVELLEPKKGERILDLGCGSGQLTKLIAESGAFVVGIDSSEKMIEDAKRKYTDIDFFVKDAANFSVDEPFDAIFSNATLHWVLEKEKAVACMYNALKPNGRLVAELGGKGNVQTIIGHLKETLVSHGFSANANKEIFYFPSVGEYSSLLEKNGFRVTLAHHFDRPTELSDSEQGVEDWLEMFGTNYFEGIGLEEKEQVKKEVALKCRDKLLKDGKLYADYKRLRVVAVKE